MDLRKWECLSCYNFFFVDCDATDYPEFCPYCGERHINKNTKEDTHAEQIR